jgi:transcription elongation factor S-II
MHLVLLRCWWQVRTLVFNLKKNTTLRGRIMYGELSPEQLVAMSSADMMSDDKREAMEATAKAQQDARRLDWREKNQAEINKQCGITTMEGMFECGRCKSKKTSYYQKQTRSADEPMTTFVTCNNCGKKWRFC